MRFRSIKNRNCTSRVATLICLASFICNIFFIISYTNKDSKISKQTKEIFDQNELQPAADILIPTPPTPNKNYDLPLCPHRPPHLLGDLEAMLTDAIPEDLVSKFEDLEEGGRIRPPICKARQRIAVIIPYRNRRPHLQILLHNLIPILIRQQADATIYVIEQAPPTTFNRGALLNVGFLEAEKVAKYDCYIFHDVDLVSLNDKHLYRCGENPKLLAVTIKKDDVFKLTYNGYFGGAVALTRQQYLDINGHSNLYFGWGGEDDDLRHRVYNKGYGIHRELPEKAPYKMIKHKRDKGNEKNPERELIMKSSRTRQDVEGLSTISYKVNSIQASKLYTWINVYLNSTDILKTAPDYTLKDLNSLEQLKSKNRTQYIKKPDTSQKPSEVKWKPKVTQKPQQQYTYKPVVSSKPQQPPKQKPVITQKPVQVTQKQAMAPKQQQQKWKGVKQNLPQVWKNVKQTEGNIKSEQQQHVAAKKDTGWKLPKGHATEP